MYEDIIDIDKILPSKVNEESIIPLCYDKLYKKIFANKNYLKPLEELLSIILPMDLELLRGNVSLTTNEPVVENNNSKRRVLDIITEIRLPKGKRSVINIEVNLNKATVVRNTSFETKVYSNEIEAGEDYTNYPKVIQICFDYFEVNKYNRDVEKVFFLKDKTNYILESNLEIRHINIEKANKLWYSNNVNGTGENKDLVLLSALLTIDNIKDFKKCLEVLPMEEETKKYIEESVIDYAKDDKSWLYVDEEKEKIKMHKTEISLARKEGIEQGIEQGIGQGIKKGQKESRLEIAKNMLKEKMSIDLISKLTGLKEKELDNLLKEI